MFHISIDHCDSLSLIDAHDFRVMNIVCDGILNMAMILLRETRLQFNCIFFRLMKGFQLNSAHTQTKYQ